MRNFSTLAKRMISQRHAIQVMFDDNSPVARALQQADVRKLDHVLRSCNVLRLSSQSDLATFNRWMTSRGVAFNTTVEAR